MIDLSVWPVLVLTAGLATRLRPLSLVRAKAAMPVAGTPIIGRILEWLRAAGVRRVVLNLHHRPETITSVVGDGSGWDLEVRYSWEPFVLGSAGGPRRALPLLEADRFLIVNGDTLTNCDLKAVARRHLNARARITMAVVPGDTARYGGVLVGAGGAVVGFTRANRTASTAPGTRTAPVASAFHFIGVQAAEADAFADLPDNEPAETVGTLYPRLIAEQDGAVVVFESNAEFLDVGTPLDYLRSVAMVAAREGRPFDRGQDCRVEPSAQLSHTVLWDRVTVGRRAHLSSCIVGDDVVVPEGARYENCVLVALSGLLDAHPF